LFQGDIGDFTPPGPYRLVLAPFNFLLHLHTDAELRRGLERVHELLRPGGMFLFDVTNPLPELLAPTGEASPSPLRRIRVGGDWYLQKERHRYDPQSRISETTFEFEPLFGDQAPFSCALSLRMMNPAEIDMLLAEAGFSGIRRLGSFTGVPFDGRGVVQVVETLRAAPEHSARQGGLGTCTGCSNLQGKPR
jgi:SAM-dependent methyltransferase